MSLWADLSVFRVGVAQIDLRAASGLEAATSMTELNGGVPSSPIAVRPHRAAGPKNGSRSNCEP